MSITINGKTLNEYIKEQTEKGEVLENVCGTIKGTRTTMNHVYGDHNGFLLTDNANVTIIKGGKRYTLKGDRIEKKNGQWYVDGKAVDWADLGGKYEEQAVVSIEIHGNVEMMQTTSGNVTINGDAHSINTTSGDVECQSAFNIHTTSGDVTCKGKPNSVSTMSGDIRVIK